VDGVWYNVTWVDSSCPHFDQNGVITEPPFTEPAVEGHWMEGVQLYKRTVHTDATGTNTAIYMNMNGTWVDVTGRISVDMPENGPAYSMMVP
jgi:hypothetical protein